MGCRLSRFQVTCEVLRDTLVPAQIGLICPSCPSSPQFLPHPKVPVMTLISSLSNVKTIPQSPWLASRLELSMHLAQSRSP